MTPGGLMAVYLSGHERSAVACNRMTRRKQTSYTATIIATLLLMSAVRRLLKMPRSWTVNLVHHNQVTSQLPQTYCCTAKSTRARCGVSQQQHQVQVNVDVTEKKSTTDLGARHGIAAVSGAKLRRKMLGLHRLESGRPLKMSSELVITMYTAFYCLSGPLPIHPGGPCITVLYPAESRAISACVIGS